jgi:hypothetical protein
MTMIDGMATLVISSPDHPAYYVSQVLGLDPDWSAEKGDARPRQGDTGAEPIRRRVYDTSMWVLEVDSNPGTKMAMVEDDAKGFGTLQVLADRLLGRREMLAQIAVDYTVELTWYGTAGGSQTGFVLPTSLLSDLADLGLDVNCTVYSQDDTSERPGLHKTDAQLAAEELARTLTPEQLAAQQLEVDRMIAEQLAASAVEDADQPLDNLPVAFQAAPPEPSFQAAPPEPSFQAAPPIQPQPVQPAPVQPEPASPPPAPRRPITAEEEALIAPLNASEPDDDFVYPPGLEPDPQFAPKKRQPH